MRRLLIFAALGLFACDSTPPATQQASLQMQTVDSTPARPAELSPPPMLQDEAPPPKPKAMPWETPTPIVFTPEDEKLRSSLPFSPAIAMDAVDGEKISIRASTPTLEYKGKIFYFANAANKAKFVAAPDQYIKAGFTNL